MKLWRGLGRAVAAAALSLPVAPVASAAIVSEGAGLGVTDAWAGVGKLGDAGSFYGTATLIGPRSVLTAAHLVAHLAAGGARFEVGGVTYASSAVAVHPGYVGGDDFDVAVITLSQPVAAGVPRYAYNRGDVDELAAGPGVKVGFGVGGDGAAGANPALYPYGTRRAGSNAIDLVTTAATQVTDGLGNVMDVPAGMLLYDFDDHRAGTGGPLGGPAVGPGEADTADGDSGGPMLQYWAALDAYVVTGITIGGSDGLSRYGDVASDLRVAAYAPWIDQQVPEPAALGVAAAAAALAWGGRRRRVR
jgi:hypothetical protein